MGARLLVFQMLLLLAGCGGDEEGPSSGNPIGEGTGEDRMAEGGASNATGFPVHILDAAGSPLEFLRAPTRILSLVPSATRTLQALGGQSLLVGRTEYDTSQSLAHLPSVGGGLDPSLETLVALEPDLIVRFAGESDSSTPIQLDNMGIRHMAVRLDGMADVRALIEDLGSVAGRPDRAVELVAEMDAVLADIQARVREAPRVRVAYILGGTPPWVAGPDTFIHELLVIAGGENVFADLEALYGPVSREEFLIREIDILLAPEGVEVHIPATNVPLVRVSPALELPGPDLAEAARDLAEILHPELFR